MWKRKLSGEGRCYGRTVVDASRRRHELNGCRDKGDASSVGGLLGDGLSHAVDHVGDADELDVAVSNDHHADVVEDQDAARVPLDAVYWFVAAMLDLDGEDARAERNEDGGVVAVGPDGARAFEATDLGDDVGVP